MGNLRFAQSERERRALTAQERRRVLELYADVAAKLRSFLESGDKRKPLQASVKRSLLKLLDREISRLSADVSSTIIEAVTKIAETVVSENAKIWGKRGLRIEGSIVTLPTDIVDTIVSGQLYAPGWSLDKAIWGANKKVHKTVESIIAAKIAENASAYDVAVAIEQYVDPSVRTPSRVIHYTDKAGIKREFYFGKVDYYAQRLARTMISHAYQESFMRVNRKNPFVTKYRWDASNSRPCPICEERDGKLFEKDDLPLDHPNGMCTFEAVIDMSDDEINHALWEWYHGGGDMYDSINAYMDDIGARHNF